MAEEKKYLKGFFIKEKTFDNGGAQLKVSVVVDDFIEELKSVKDGEWANLIIGRRKTPSESGVTHFIKIDPWKPDSSKKTQPKAGVNKGDDDLPF